MTYRPARDTVILDLTWQEQALCAQTDPEAFYPEEGMGRASAKRTCLACEVRTECLEYALANDERFGVWGAKTTGERDRILKERRRAAKAAAKAGAA